MLAEHEVPETFPWTGRRKMCMLELTRSHKDVFEPLGFGAFDIHFPSHLSSEVSGWIPDDVGGRVLFLAGQRHLYPDPVPPPLAPRRDTPLFIWLTHRRIRVLYHCTPMESWALGKRLTLLSRDALGSHTVEECSPAAFASLLLRWVEADPDTAALVRPQTEAQKDYQVRGATQWGICWNHPPLQPLLTVPEANQRESRYDPAQYLTYLDDPIVLVPLRILIQNPRLTPPEVMATVKDDVKLRRLMTLGPYSTLPLYSQYRTLTLLLPMSGSNWRRRLTMFRNRMGLLLDCQTAIGLATTTEATAVIRQFEAARVHLGGANEIYDPPYAGARTTPLELPRARWLRRQIMRALALPVDENDLERMQVGSVFH